MPLGRFSENTCDQARNQAKEYAGRVIAGDDIVATRQAEKQLAAKTELDFNRLTYRLTYRPIQARKKTGEQTIKLIERVPQGHTLLSQLHSARINRQDHQVVMAGIEKCLSLDLEHNV